MICYLLDDGSKCKWQLALKYICSWIELWAESQLRHWMCQRGRGGATEGWASTETIGCVRGGEEAQQRAGSQLKPLDVSEGKRRRNRGLGVK
jgi:hypothetical protein